MKRAVSISIGSSKRNKSVEVELLGQKVVIERIGTDGDMEKAAQLFKELDGTVDAFGVGGADLGLMVDDKWYPLHSVSPMIRFIKKTPVVDGTGVKNTLENMAAPMLDQELGKYIGERGRKVLIMTGSDRWGLTKSFTELGYETIFGDLMFSLDIPVPLRTTKQIKTFIGILMPVVSRVPFKWVYPTGAKQEIRTPKFEKYFHWATIIAGDCHYIKKFMPNDLDGKIVVTNTTTPEDVALFKQCGIKYLVTTTPVLDGRSFGTNMIESALIAVSGKNRKLSYEEYSELLNQLNFKPQLQELN